MQHMYIFRSFLIIPSFLVLTFLPTLPSFLPSLLPSLLCSFVPSLYGWSRMGSLPSFLPSFLTLLSYPPFLPPERREVRKDEEG